MTPNDYNSSPMNLAYLVLPDLDSLRIAHPSHDHHLRLYRQKSQCLAPPQRLLNPRGS